MESALKSENVFKRKSNTIIGPVSKKRRCDDQNTAEKKQSCELNAVPVTIDSTVSFFFIF